MPIVTPFTRRRAPPATPWKDDRFTEYKNSGAGAGAASSARPQLSGSQATGQEVTDWLGDWTPSAS